MKPKLQKLGAQPVKCYCSQQNVGAYVNFMCTQDYQLLVCRRTTNPISGMTTSYGLKKISFGVRSSIIIAIIIVVHTCRLSRPAAVTVFTKLLVNLTFDLRVSGLRVI